MIKCLCLFLVLFFLPFPAEALKISPFKMTVNPGESQTFRVENNSAEPAAVQVSVTTWEVSPDGIETNHDAEEDFAIFPAQLVLQPHESRAVRIQYLGSSQSIEKPYRLIAEQLPVNGLKGAPASGSAVRFLLKFKAALYVAEGKVREDIIVEKAERLLSGLRLTLLNKGTGHALIKKPILHLSCAEGRTQRLSSAQLQEIEGENIHAGQRRDFFILLSEPISNIAAAKIDFEPAF
jgi:fimbrial chaperone protein